MVNVDEAIIAKMKAHGHEFEILVDCTNAIKMREGQAVDINDVLAVQDIFSDAKKGMLASEGAMKQVFMSTDPKEVAIEIIKKGEIQLTSDYKKQIRDEKRKQIINMIHTRSIDPRTNAPHPVTRIEAAFDDAKVHIDEFRAPEAQLETIASKLRPILPMNFETREIAIRIPAVYAAKSYSAVKQFCKTQKEEWQTDGSLVMVVALPAGLQEEFFNSLNSLTKGEVELKILKRDKDGINS